MGLGKREEAKGRGWLLQAGHSCLLGPGSGTASCPHPNPTPQAAPHSCSLDGEGSCPSRRRLSGCRCSQRSSLGTRMRRRSVPSGRPGTRVSVQFGNLHFLGPSSLTEGGAGLEPESSQPRLHHTPRGKGACARLPAEGTGMGLRQGPGPNQLDPGSEAVRAVPEVPRFAVLVKVLTSLAEKKPDYLRLN